MAFGQNGSDKKDTFCGKTSSFGATSRLRRTNKLITKEKTNYILVGNYFYAYMYIGP